MLHSKFGSASASREDPVEENGKPARAESPKASDKVVTPAEVDRSLRELTESLTQLRDSL
jgi:hypothetical protein